MAKHKLIVDFDFDFAVIGIGCHGHDYQLCWAINQHLNLSLSRDEKDIERKVKKENCAFACFSFLDETNETTYRLVVNRGDKGYLIPELKQSDFFLVIEGQEAAYAADLCDLLNEIKPILLAFEIDMAKLKSKHNLLFD